MDRQPAFYLVVDLEATCDENHKIPRNQTEIIEIGAVLVDGATLAPAGELGTFVRPVARRTLTPFCTKLTSITQADVDSAPLFPQALAKLGALIAGRDALFCSWGDYDRDQLARDAQRHGVRLPFGPGHLNLKRRFSEQLGESRPYGMAAALRRVGLRLAGTHHRGIDDARNIARLLPWILGRARAAPEAPSAPPRR
jgi:inhibitor of KinA sporulation pathway (predicted exonuclease)